MTKVVVPNNALMPIVAGIIGWIGVQTWLEVRLNWPRAYGVSCHTRGCMVEDIWYSPLLLHGGGWDSRLLFVCFWLWPIFIFGGLFYVYRQKRRPAQNLSASSFESRPE